MKKNKNKILVRNKCLLKKKPNFISSYFTYEHGENKQIKYSNSLIKNYNGMRFPSSIKKAIKVTFTLVLLVFSLKVSAQDYYIATFDLNLRNGAGKSYKSLTIISKGDTVKMINNNGNYWAKIEYNDKIGYSSKEFLQKIQIQDKGINELVLQKEQGDFFPLLIVFFVLFIIIPIILAKSGKKHRDKPLVTLLSLFFGAFGFQNFYLGQTYKGILSLFFSWSFIPLLIGIIDFFKFVSMNKDNYNKKYNNKPIQVKKANVETQKTQLKYSSTHISVSPNSKSQNKKEHKNSDSSIIDVISANFDLNIEQVVLSESLTKPPYWGHTYVYSYDEIIHATKAQKEYYILFKKKVLNNEFVDIQGYSNYAFILYFDFLNEYKGHQDIKLLEEQFKLLGQICPKTKNYSLQSLQDELRYRSDSYSVNKLKDLEEPSYQFEYGYSDYNPDLYKLGNQYRVKLGLDKQEIRWLNKFYNPSNVFTSIEGCCIAIIIQYVFILKELNKQLKKKETTLVKEVTYFKEKLKSIYTEQYGA